MSESPCNTFIDQYLNHFILREREFTDALDTLDLVTEPGLTLGDTDSDMTSRSIAGKAFKQACKEGYLTRQSANNSSANGDLDWVQYLRSGVMDSGASKHTSDGIGTINLVKCRQGFSGFIGQGAVADFKCSSDVDYDH